MPSEFVYHEPVLAKQSVDLLVADPEGIFVDGTVGGGGHSRLIFERLTGKGRLIGCDRDADAIARSRQVLPDSVTLIQCRFSELEDRVSSLVGSGVSGVLLDLGVSSFQIDTPERGFSHRFTGPLDLRMDRTVGETAADLLARLDLNELTRLIGTYGEDSQARRIAKAIVRERAHHSIQNTEDLASVIGSAVPATRNKSLARVFQALRIVVNDELGELEAGLAGAWNLLKPGGRLVVISYHSLEDRIVKTFMKTLAHPQQNQIGFPFSQPVPPLAALLLRKPMIPDSNEIDKNVRARSAKLRAMEKIAQLELD